MKGKTITKFFEWDQTIKELYKSIYKEVDAAFDREEWPIDQEKIEDIVWKERFTKLLSQTNELSKNNFYAISHMCLREAISSEIRSHLTIRLLHAFMDLNDD